MPMVILRLLAVFMIDYDGLVCATWIFADNPAALCVIGEEFNIPLGFPYNGKVPFPYHHHFLFLCEHKFSFE